MLNKEIRNLPQQMVTGVAAADSVITVRIIELSEILICLYQCLSIFERVLRMYIVVGSTVANE